jgi:muramoyltetrapeptide carboxypeptidase
LAEPRVWPAPLTPGSVVRVVAPAGPVERGRLAAGVAVIASWGLRVELGEQVLAVDERLPYLAGADAIRAADFTAAWTDPEVAAVWAARGGYGSQRMLDHLDWRPLRAAGTKHLIGFSDLTALHGALGRELGQVTLHGPGAASVGQLLDVATVASLQRLLQQPPLPGAVVAGGRTLGPGSAVGRLWGGNLSLLASQVGVGAPPDEPSVLVLEEVGEPAYRIDRYLTQLIRAGWLDRVGGVLVGDVGAGSPVVAERLGALDVPIVVDAPIGHGDRNLALPLGAGVRLDAPGPTGTLTLC